MSPFHDDPDPLAPSYPRHLNEPTARDYGEGDAPAPGARELSWVIDCHVSCCVGGEAPSL